MYHENIKLEWEPFAGSKEVQYQRHHLKTNRIKTVTCFMEEPEKIKVFLDYWNENKDWHYTTIQSLRKHRLGVK